MFFSHLACPARSGAVVKMFCRWRPPTLNIAMIRTIKMIIKGSGGSNHRDVRNEDMPPCIESWGDCNDRDVEGVEGGTGRQQSGRLHHPNQTWRSEKLVRTIFFSFQNPKKIPVAFQWDPQVTKKNEVTR